MQTLEDDISKDISQDGGEINHDESYAKYPKPTRDQFLKNLYIYINLYLIKEGQVSEGIAIFIDQRSCDIFIGHKDAYDFDDCDVYDVEPFLACWVHNGNWRRIDNKPFEELASKYY